MTIAIIVCISFQYYKILMIFANHQIHKNLQFIELTLKTILQKGHRFFQRSLTHDISVFKENSSGELTIFLD